MATDDHGLEVLRKSAEFVDTDPNELLIRTRDAKPGAFEPPEGTVGFTVVEGATDRTYQFRDAYPAGTILKTVIVYYSNASKTDITGAEIV